ncbi:hypothetical protein ACFUIW_12040 [Streptomyces sp. NPDC057245]
MAHKGANQRQLADATGCKKTYVSKEPYVSKVKHGRALPSRYAKHHG